MLFSARDELLAAWAASNLEKLLHLFQPTSEEALKRAHLTIEILFCHAARSHQPEIAKYCLESGITMDRDVQSSVVGCSNLDIYALAVPYGYDINRSPGQDFDGSTIAISYGREGNLPVPRWSLEQGLDITRGGFTSTHRNLTTGLKSRVSSAASS
jgi:hypothetical protein